MNTTAVQDARYLTIFSSINKLKDLKRTPDPESHHVFPSRSRNFFKMIRRRNIGVNCRTNKRFDYKQKILKFFFVFSLCNDPLYSILTMRPERHNVPVPTLLYRYIHMRMCPQGYYLFVFSVFLIFPAVQP
jgi:hypothetical protein